MSDRKYSVPEIDRMRRAVAVCCIGRDPANVEDRLRTYMLNGTDPQELEAVAAEAEARYMKQCPPDRFTPLRPGRLFSWA